MAAKKRLDKENADQQLDRLQQQHEPQRQVPDAPFSLCDRDSDCDSHAPTEVATEHFRSPATPVVLSPHDQRSERGQAPLQAAPHE
eukprot:2298397-Amphidinium_carterae.1